MAWVDPPTWDADDPWLHTDANQYVTDNTKYLYGQLSNAFVLNEWDTTAVAVSNTTSWSNLITFVVDADELAGQNGFRIKAGIRVQNTTGTHFGMSIRLRYGGTTFCSLATDELWNNTEVDGFIEAIVYETAANTQASVLQVSFGGAVVNPLNQGNYVSGDYGVGAVDSSSARNLEIDVAPSYAYANFIVTKLQHEVHKLTAA